MEKKLNFTEEERVYFSLKGLFESFGYTQYRMRKFEEYSLYAENRSFLQNDDIITFSDRSGKLLALKPDVTLSIVKNSKANGADFRKLYYRESVYRLDKGNKQFREISQIGLEYLGDMDCYSQLEVLSLAAESLKAVGESYLIDISHVGVIGGIMKSCGKAVCPKPVADCIRAKNLHDMLSVCRQCGIPDETAKKLSALMGAGGGNKDRLKLLAGLFPEECGAAVEELKELLDALERCGKGKAFNVDFSLINDPAYYNGVIFQGYVHNFPHVVLSGGRYDNLIKKFNAGFGGMGFALYPDELNYYYGRRPQYDGDVLLLYKRGASPAAVMKKAEELVARGLTVQVASRAPEGMKFEKVIEV